MIYTETLTQLLMTPQEYSFVGIEPPIVFNPETAKDWYTPYGITLSAFEGQLDRDMAQKLRGRFGFVEIPRRSALVLGIQSPVGHVLGVPFVELDTFGITRDDPRVVQGVWDSGQRSFIHVRDYTDIWRGVHPKEIFHLRREAQRSRIEGRQGRKER